MTLFDFSTNPDSVPFLTVLRALNELARTAGVDVLLVGATARDLALAAEGHEGSLRATNDVDIAVAVADRASFKALVADLELARTRNPHKFLVDGIEVDIVPFGGIEREDRTIEWPDGTTMNTLGFAEALRCALQIRLADDLIQAVASLAAQTALKIFAWADRGGWTDRDAVDLRTLLHAYSEGRRLDAIYTEDGLGPLETYDYEPRRAGAHLLGVDVRRSLGVAVATRCAELIKEDRNGRDRLGLTMRGNTTENVLLLDAFVAGAGAAGSPPVILS